MYWFFQRTKSSYSATQRAHLGLDAFEQREAPSVLTDLLRALAEGVVVVPAQNGSPAKVVLNLPADATSTPQVPRLLRSVLVFNQAPQIVDFQAVVGPEGQVTFSGRVIDDQSVTGDVVTITGNGINLTTAVGAGGTFSVTTTVSSEGDIVVTAQVKDVFGNTSATATTIFTPSVGDGGGTGGTGDDDDSEPGGPGSGGGGGTGGGDGGPVGNTAPSMSNVTVVVDDGVVTISGTVTDDSDPTGYAVQIQGGGIDTIALVDENGNFSTSFPQPIGTGTVVQVKVIDSNGDASPIEMVNVPGA